jgi:integrase
MSTYLDTIMGKSRPAAGPMTMAVFHDAMRRDYMARGKDRSLPKVDRVFRIAASPEVGAKTAEDFVNAASRYEASLGQISAGTRPMLRRTYKAICARAYELGFVPSKPEYPETASVRDESDQSPPPSLEEVQSLLDYLGGRIGAWTSHRLYALSAVVVWAGLNLREEALQLRVEDIDLARGTIRVRRREAKKYTAFRSPVAIADELAPILAGWMARVDPKCEWVFPGVQQIGPWQGVAASCQDPDSLQKAACAAGTEGLTFQGLRRFHHANVQLKPSIPGLRVRTPPRSTTRADSPVAAPGHVPLRELELDEATRLMAWLRRESAAWKEHRRYAAIGIGLLAGLRREEVLGMRREDVHLDRSPPKLVVASRAVVLTEEAADILRRWLGRADQPETPWVFPGIQLTGPWVFDDYESASGLASQFEHAVEKAGITGRVIFGALAKLHRRCGGRVELGDAWRSASDPEPELDGPSRRAATSPEFAASRSASTAGRIGRIMRRKVLSQRELDAWDPPIPDVQIKGPDDPVFVCGQDKGVLNPAVYRAVKLLADEFPGGLSRAEMTRRYEGEGWRQVFIQLMKDPDWARAISTPKKGRDGLYRILPRRPGPAV